MKQQGAGARLRQATRADIAGMHRVRLAVRENRLTSTAITEADYVPAIEETGRGWVVEEDGRVVAFAVGNRTDGNIWALFVDPEHEGRGYGRRLHEAMVDWLWAQGVRSLWLTTDSGTRAEKFYASAGWKRAGTQGKEVRFEMTTAPVRKVQASELGRVAIVLARAFANDPAASWVFPDPARRAQQLERAYHLYLSKIWFRHDECHTTPQLAGAAIWLPPGAWAVPPLQQLLLLPQMALKLGGAVARVLTAVTALEAKHPKVPHYYLAFVGVDPAHQRRGVGHALLKPMLARCDREGMPAYLEASSPLNRPLYEGLGFEVTEEFTFGKNAPPLWRMWREPRRNQPAA